MTTLYDRDHSAWAEQTVQLLHSHQFHQLDLDHLIEGVESLGKSQRRALASSLTVLIIHLLKWTYQPSGRQYTPEGNPKAFGRAQFATAALKLRSC